MTPLSGSNAYCTGEQFCNHFDWRTAAEYLFDASDWSSNQSFKTAYPDRATVEADETLIYLLKTASGMVEAAASAGKRYLPDDLANLTGNSKNLLAKIVANLAAVSLMQRRPNYDGPRLPISEEVEMFLTAIARGERIFGIEETANAGYMHTVEDTPEDVENRNLPTFQARRMFGIRSNRWTNKP